MRVVTRPSTRSRSTAKKASIKWDLHDLHRLEYFDYGDPGILRGWKSIHVTDGDHPYMKNWWVSRSTDRLRAHLRFIKWADFLQGLTTGKPTSPTFREALETQAVCDAVLDSAEQHKWEDVIQV